MENPAIARSARFAGVVPHFRVGDVAKTVEYYRDVLGFEIDGYWDGEAVHRERARRAVFGIVRRDRVSVHFNRADAAELQPVVGDGAYDVYFEISDVDSFAREVRGRGAEVLDGPADRPYGRRELVLRDCNGRVLAFGEERVGQESP